MCRLEYVEKHGERLPVTVLRRLSEREHELVEAAAQSTQDLKEEDVQGLLQRIHSEKWWVACTCNDERRPLLSVRKHGGTYSLLRLRHRGTHASWCPLYREQRKRSGTADDKASQKRRSRPVENVCFHRVGPARKDHNESKARDAEEKPTLFSSADQIENADAKRRTSSVMIRTMETLIETAGLNHYFDQRSRREQMRSLADAAENIMMAGWLPLKKNLFFAPWKVGMAAARIKQGEEDWPAWAKPHGVMVFVATGVSGKTARYGQGDEEVVSVAESIDIERVNAGPPFLLMLTLAAAGRQTGWIEPIRAEGFPIAAADILFPVDSPEEREVLNMLILWNASRGNGRLSIQKPVLEKFHREERGFLLRIGEQEWTLRIGGRGETDRHGRSDANKGAKKPITVRPSGGRLSWREKRRIGIELRGITSGS